MPSPTGDFTASTVQELQVKINDIFQPGPSEYELRYPVPVAQKLLMEQTAVPSLRMTDGVCEGVKVMWLKGGDLTPSIDASTPPNDLTCDIPAGWKADSDAVSYENNVFLAIDTTVDLRDCSNEFEANEKRGFQVARTLVELRRRLQTKMINFLDTQKQSNQDSMLAGGGVVPGFTGDYSLDADGKTILVPLDEFKNPDSLSYMRAVAENNGMDNFFYIGGRTTFHHERFNAQFRSQNDNERYLNPAFASENIVTDTRSLDQTLSGANLFAIDPSSYIFWNSVWEANLAPVQIKADKFEYHIQDPVLTVLNAQGQRVPLVYQVDMDLACVGVDSLTKRVISENHRIKLVAGLAGSPTGVNGETGVIKFLGAAA